MAFFVRLTTILTILAVGVYPLCQVNELQLLCTNELIDKLTTDNPRKLSSIVIRDSEVPILSKGLFSGFVSVQTLLVQNSKVATIEQGALDFPNLKVLNLDHNNLQEIPGGVFDLLPKLETLSLAINSITKFSIGTAPSLKNLQVFGNKITELPDLTALKIEELHVGDNPLMRFDGLPKTLKKLVAYNTKLTYLPEDDLRNLEHLNLGDSSVTITEVRYQKLKELYLYNCKLTQMPDLPGLTQLQVLNLGDNPLQEVSAIVLSRLRNLQKLFLYNTQLIEFPDLNLNLEELNLGDNYLTRAPRIKPSLKQLHLYHNRLTEVDIPTPGLRVLSLENNQIESIRDLPITLERLTVFNNKLTRLPTNFKELTSLKILKAFGNRLQLQRIANRNLEEVELNSNNLRAIPKFQNLSKLKKIFLQDNLLSHIGPGSFTNLPALTTINLAHNQVNNIDCDVFSDLNLELLDLSHNTLSVFPGSCLRSSTKLKELHVEDNQVRTFDVRSFLSQHQGLVRLGLNNNQFSCEELRRSLQGLSEGQLRLLDGSPEGGVHGISCTDETTAVNVGFFEESRIYRVLY